MKMSGSVYAVIVNGQRLSNHDTRPEAEAQAARLGGEVRLLDRPRPAAPKPLPAGVLDLLRGASEAERERALACYR